MAVSTSDLFVNEKGSVTPALDTPGLRKAIHRFVTETGFPSGTSTVSLDPLAPQTFPVTASLLRGAHSAAERFSAATRAVEDGVPTLNPLAWVQQGDDQSILFTQRIPGAISLQEALLYHYHEHPVCAPLMDLLQICATAVRTLHQAGWEHGNLTNEHLMVLASGPGEWEQAWVQGLLRIPDSTPAPLSASQRGRDNARIHLPSDFLRVFQEMQWAPDIMPPEFRKAERRARRRHTSSLREARHHRQLPNEEDIWIWDDRSMQAIPALRSKDKRKYYRKRDGFLMLKSNLRWGLRIRKETRRCLEQAWTRPVDLQEKTGISINVEPDRFEPELNWLEPLGAMPVLVRLYHHESPANQRYAIEAVRRLHSQGHQVSVALVQSRKAVLQPGSWRRFVEQAAGGISGFAEALEVGHAINRVKWGFWSVPEYQQFIEPFTNWSHRYPQLPLWGPAGIDFEFPRILPMLDQWPANSLSALSHHMYVDRRGAPENTQAGYDLVHKLAMARAMARVHPGCEEKVVVSEVNWPLQGTGVWSPVGSPYQSPGERTGDPSVNEETYADYLRRYLLLALCSGMADRVYWWNLAAHGFGLVDDRDPNGWRPRPAYHAFKHVVDTFRGSRFEHRTSSQDGWTYHFTRNGTPHTLFQDKVTV